MTDRELLEAAAKAAGMHWLIWEPWMEPVVPPAFRVPGDKPHWTPLTDDGDALRLAVKLGLSCQFTSYYSVCYAGSPAAMQFTEKSSGDPCAATRRVIVRAAASIGALMGAVTGDKP